MSSTVNWRKRLGRLCPWVAASVVPTMVVAVVSGLVAHRAFSNWTALRLDPTHAEHFRRANAKLRARAPNVHRVVLVGDSRFSQWRNPLAALENAEVVNSAFGGDTSAQVLLRLQRDVLDLKPDVVVIQVGINDLQAIGITKRTDAIVRSTCSNLERIVARLRAANILTILTTVFPVGPIPPWRRLTWSDETLAAIARVNQQLRGLAGPRVVVVDSNAFFDDGGRMKSAYARDHFHLTEEGYAVLGGALLPIVESALNQDALQ